MSNLQKVSPGDKLKISAETFNTFIDAARDFRHRQQNWAQAQKHLNSDTAIIRVHNNSELDCPQFGVLSLSGPVFEAEDVGFLRDGIVMSGVAPDGTDAASIVIAQEPIAAGRFGLAQVSGITLAKVTGDGDTACPDEDDVIRLHCGDGGIQILWSDEGSSSRWAIVRLGHSMGNIKLAKLNSALAAGGMCTASVWSGDPLSDNGDDLDVYDWLLGEDESLDSGTKVVIALLSGKWYVIQASCAVE